VKNIRAFSSLPPGLFESTTARKYPPCVPVESRLRIM